jgi:N-acetylmuramoyl-L-alanine amidase
MSMIQRPLNALKYIVIHHSVTPDDWTIKELRQLHKGMGYQDIGYHFVVQKNGLHVGRPILFRGAHAITEKREFGNIDMNWSGIGVCILGDFSGLPPCSKLINEVAFAVRRIAEKWKIPMDRNHIIGHDRVSRTLCPGLFTMEALYRKLNI